MARHSDELLAALAGKAVADGFPQIKLKVGRDLAEDHWRLKVARGVVGEEFLCRFRTLHGR